MLLLLFQVGNERFGLDATNVIEVIPVVSFRKAPQASEHVAGLINYRSTIVPVIDFSSLLSGHPAPFLFSTRIILIDYCGGDNVHHILGLLAERVTETLRCSEKDFQAPGITADTAPYLGGIFLDSTGMIQQVIVEKVIPPALQDALFTGAKEA